jgi:hypothetical protein
MKTQLKLNEQEFDNRPAKKMKRTKKWKIGNFSKIQN